jgi:TolB-like protein
MVWHRRLLNHCLILFATCVTHAVICNAGSSAYSGAFLLNRPGSRISAIGNTGVVSSFGADALFWNPANLGTLSSGHFIAYFSRLPFDITQTMIGVKLTQHSRFNLGIGVNNISYGDIPLRSGPTETPEGTATPSDIEISAAGSYRIFRALTLGLSIQYIGEELINRDRTVAGGFGLDYELKPFRFGISSVNHFGRLWNNSLPVIHRAGLSYSLFQDKLNLYGSASLISNDELTLGFGTEYLPISFLILRAGYATKNLESNSLGTAHGLRLGIGLKKERLEASYAYSVTSGIDETHGFSFSYTFDYGQFHRRQRQSFVSDESLTPIAVFPFENKTTDTSLSWFGASIAEVLKTELSNSRYFRVIQVPGESPENPEVQKYLKEQSVRYYIAGSYSQAGDEYRVNANLRELNNPSLLRGIPKIGRLADLQRKATDLAWELDETLYDLTSPKDKIAEYQSIMSINSGESQLLRIAQFEMEGQVIPSQALRYKTNPLISFVIKNVTAEPIYRMTIEGKTTSIACRIPTIQIENLDPDSSRTISLFADFNADSLSQNKEIRNGMITLKISGVYQRQPFTISQYKSIAILPRNEIDWQYAGSLAAFVAPSIVKSINPDFLTPPDTLQDLGSLVQVLKISSYFTALNLTYIKDPLINGYLGTELDNVKFPDETIRDRNGDCDDFSVLYASLLRGSGINTQFVITADHVFCLVNTEIHQKYLNYVTNDSTMVIVRNKQLWIPIDCTSLTQGFMRAWEIGARLLQRDQGNNNYVEIDKSSLEYPSIAIAQVGLDASYDVDGNKLYKTFFEDLNVVAQLRSQNQGHILAINDRGNKLDAELYCKLLYSMALTDQLDSAIAIGRQALTYYPHNERLLNNFANCYLLTGRLDSAGQLYSAARELDSTNIISLINLALTFACIGEDSTAIKLYAEILNYISYEELSDFLGIVVSSAPGLKGARVQRYQNPPKELVQFHIESARELRRGLKPTEKTITNSMGKDMPSTAKRILASTGRRGASEIDRTSLLNYLVWIK